MRTLYLDCGMGAAGDMLAAALLELISEGNEFIEKVNGLGIPGVSVERELSVKCGITGTHIKVTVNGEEEESHGHAGHVHSHAEHAHEGHVHSHAEHAHEEHVHSHAEHVHKEHTHSSMENIRHIVEEHLELPQKVRKDIMAVYGLIAQAESHVHGVPVTDIHFHEVGTMDAIADIAMVCLLMDMLSPEQIVVSPIHVGSGQVRCAHGTLPVPAPATAHILRGIPIYGGSVKGELCTPTGAALLKHFATKFGHMPIMKTEVIGYGMGKKDFEAANCIRAFLGETC